MSSYADELLDDFGDDFGEEQGNDDDFFTDEGLANGAQVDTDMVEARDEGDGNEDADMIDEEAAAAAEDEAEAKAKIEKMNLGAVRDVRTVAGLMKTLKPVLEVSSTHTRLCPNSGKCLHLYLGTIALTACLERCRKSHITKSSQHSRSTAWEMSKTIPSTTC